MPYNHGMPLYEFRCSSCGEPFEFLSSLADRDEKAVCPVVRRPRRLAGPRRLHRRHLAHKAQSRGVRAHEGQGAGVQTARRRLTSAGGWRPRPAPAGATTPYGDTAARAGGTGPASPRCRDRPGGIAPSRRTPGGPRRAARRRAASPGLPWSFPGGGATMPFTPLTHPCPHLSGHPCTDTGKVIPRRGAADNCGDDVYPAAHRLAERARARRGARPPSSAGGRGRLPAAQAAAGGGDGRRGAARRQPPLPRPPRDLERRATRRRLGRLHARLGRTRTGSGEASAEPRTLAFEDYLLPADGDPVWVKVVACPVFTPEEGDAEGEALAAWALFVLDQRPGRQEGDERRRRAILDLLLESPTSSWCSSARRARSSTCPRRCAG